MSIIGEIQINISTNPWPRPLYDRICADAGIVSTQAGYDQWVLVCERVSGATNFETAIRRASAALAGFGIAVNQAQAAFAEFGDVMAKAFAKLEQK